MPGDKIAEVPELVNLICQLHDHKGRSNLLTVSKLFFDAAVPFVWEEVSGVHNLLTLMPDVMFKSSKRDNKFCQIIMNLPHNPSPLIRFDMYAQFVRRLNILPWNILDYEVHNWSWLESLAREKILLPNLEELKMGAFPLGEQNQILWIHTFLSPSLSSIVVDGGHGSPQQIGSLLAKNLLERVKVTCPNLQHLQVFPENENEGPITSTSKASSALQITYFWGPSFYDLLSGLHLQKLGCPTDILSSGNISILNQLPSLESLDLYGGCETDYSLPDTAPILIKHLGLHYIDLDDLENINGLGLLAGINSLHVVFGDNLNADEWDEWEAETFRFICQDGRSLLTELTLDSSRTAFALPISETQLMSALPLDTVRLKGLVSGSLALVPSFWPKLKQFQWDAKFKVEGLSSPTTLPNLRHLTLKLVGDTDKLRQLHDGCTLPALRTFEINGWPFGVGSDLCDVAQYMVSLWPDLDKVCLLPLAKKRVDSAKLANSETQLKTLNRLIKLQRSVNKAQRDAEKIKSGVITKYGKEVLDEMMR